MKIFPTVRNLCWNWKSFPTFRCMFSNTIFKRRFSLKISMILIFVLNFFFSEEELGHIMQWERGGKYFELKKFFALVCRRHKFQLFTTPHTFQIVQFSFSTSKQILFHFLQSSWMERSWRYRPFFICVQSLTLFYRFDRA